MSRIRHKNSKGPASTGVGSQPAVTDAYSGGNSVVAKHAKERKRGGRVEGAKPKTRMDRIKRRDGGRVGANTHPLSTAAKTSASPAEKG